MHFFSPRILSDAGIVLYFIITLAASELINTMASGYDGSCRFGVGPGRQFLIHLSWSPNDRKQRHIFGLFPCDRIQTGRPLTESNSCVRSTRQQIAKSTSFCLWQPCTLAIFG